MRALSPLLRRTGRREEKCVVALLVFLRARRDCRNSHCGDKRWGRHVLDNVFENVRIDLHFRAWRILLQHDQFIFIKRVVIKCISDLAYTDCDNEFGVNGSIE